MSYHYKYLKYKNKYFNLLNQNGGIVQPGMAAAEPEPEPEQKPLLAPQQNIDRVLVIGGGSEDRYGIGFFEIGNHPTSKDWTKVLFWDKLNILLGNYKFDAIIFDNGSESWTTNIPDNVFNDNIIPLILNHINEDGFILTTGKKVRNDKSSTVILDKLLNCGFTNVGLLRFGNVIEDQIYNILSPNNADIIDKTDIHDIDTEIGTYDPRGFIIENQAFKSVTEKNQIVFIRNRLFSFF